MASEKLFAKTADVVLVIITSVFITETHSCNINVCLTWSAIKDEITFKCRVNSLSWQVRFFNQFDKEQAYCLNPIPFSHCFPISKNCTITQDAKRNITILSVRGRIDNSINGAWTCYHGTNIDNAVVNVTVLREAFLTGSHDSSCWEKNTTWTFVGFSVAFFVFYTVRCMRKNFNCTAIINCTKRESLNELTKKVIVLILKQVIFYLLILVLIFIPLVGYGKVDCSEQYNYIAFGLVIGFLLIYLFVTEKGIKWCGMNCNKNESNQNITADDSLHHNTTTDVDPHHDTPLELQHDSVICNETDPLPTINV